MKKISGFLIILITLVSCSTSSGSNGDSYENYNNLYEQKHNKETLVNKEYVWNFHSVEGEKDSHLFVQVDEDGEKAYVRKDGVEYHLARISSASGLVFSKDEITLSMKGKDAMLEIGDKIYNYFDLGKKSLNYGKKAPKAHDEGHNHKH